MPRRLWARQTQPDTLTVAQFLALPPQDNGTILDVLLDAAAGKHAQFKFRSASANPYKWEVVGSPPGLFAQSEALFTTVGDNAARIATGSDIVLPLAGLYEWDWGHLNLMGTSASAGSMVETRPTSSTGTGTLAVNPGNAANANANSATWGAGFATGTGFGAFYYLTRHNEFVIAGTPPFTVSFRYTALNHTPNFYQRWQKARPVAVVGP